MSDLIQRQAVIDALGERPMVWTGSDYELGARNQYDADVLAIETVPAAQSFSCDHENDTISRQAAIERIESHIRVGDELYPLTDTDKILNHAFEIAASCVYNLPSAQPERKRGRWIPVTNGRGGHECNLCHTYAPSFKSGDEWLTDYCGNCGARMEGE